MEFFNTYGNFLIFILTVGICVISVLCYLTLRQIKSRLGTQKFTLKCMRCSEAKAEYFSFYVTNTSLNDKILSGFGIEVSGHHINIGKLADGGSQDHRLIKQRNSLVFNLDVIAVENEVFAVADRYGISGVKLYAVDGMGTLSAERVADLEKMLKKDFKAGRRAHRGFFGRFNMPKTENADTPANNGGENVPSENAGLLPPTVTEMPIPASPSAKDRIRNIFKKKK